MRRLRWSLCVLTACIAAPAIACINTFDSKLRMYLWEGDSAAVAAVIAELDAKHAERPTLENSNDRAVARLITGRYSEALTLLRQVEKSYPGKAMVAANLGTALELSGQNEEALTWIRTGVQRDPKEHHGTEWLHVMILEAKIALAKDPEWLKTHSVIGLDFGQEPRPTLPVTMPLDESGRPRTAKEIGDAIYYQLREREKFVGPPDAVMADLHETRANLDYATGYHWKSTEIRPNYPAGGYQAAQRYGSDDGALVSSRLRQLETDFPGRSWYARPAVTKP